MTGEKGRLRISAKSDGKFAFAVGQKHRELTFEETFACGHSLLKSKKYAAAAEIFNTLLKARGGDRRVMIMLALCEAKLDHFEVCQQILRDAFEGKDEPLAEKLHSAFVYYKMGMSAEVVQELAAIVTDRADLPTVCLILGDLFGRKRQLDKARSCWKTAIKRDERGGAVALAARGELARLRKKTKSQRKKDA
jgi:hypothetical protein